MARVTAHAPPPPRQVAPGFLQLYAPHVSAMLLAGGPRLFERLVQATATGAAVLVSRAPSPAVVAYLAERGAVGGPGTQVGDCTPSAAPAPRRSPTQALFDAERKLWELEDEEHDDASQSAEADDDDADDSPPAPSAAPRGASRLKYPRGSPPPRAGRPTRRPSRRK
jgi:hypothetical protein